MSNGILEGRPEQIGGNTKASWHKLTDSDIEGVWGKRDQFLRALQEKYGFTRAKTIEEVELRLKEYD